MPLAYALPLPFLSGRQIASTTPTTSTGSIMSTTTATSTTPTTYTPNSMSTTASIGTCR
ncbi:hypothetical protein Ptr902_12599 [Pyrenophora tritici-repentis]|nr:hypothetical protein Ptr902_12599 [Pyrenophora tritici-repentis]